MSDNRMLMDGEPPEYWVPLSVFNELKDKLTAAEAKNKPRMSLYAEIARLQEHVATAEAERDRLKTAVCQLQAVKQKKHNVIQHKKAANSRLHKECNAMREQLVAAKQENERLRDGFRLCLGLYRDVPWVDVTESDIDGFVDRIEQLRAAKVGGAL